MRCKGCGNEIIAAWCDDLTHPAHFDANDLEEAGMVAGYTLESFGVPSFAGEIPQKPYWLARRARVHQIHRCKIDRSKGASK